MCPFSSKSNKSMIGQCYNCPPSDGPNMIPLDKLESLLKQLTDIDNLIKN